MKRCPQFRKQISSHFSIKHILNNIRFIIDGEEYPLLPEEYIISRSWLFTNMYEHHDNPDDCFPGFVGLNIEVPNRKFMKVYLK